MKKNSVRKSFLWKFLERFSIQITGFITTLVLARLLNPQEYGTVSLVLIFISFATTFVQGGFNTALIQKEKVTEKDSSSVFYFSFFIAILLYALLYFLSPYVAVFFKQPIIEPVLRLLSLALFPGAYYSVQIALASREMQFDRIFKSSFISTIIASIVSISLALSGAGIWSLVVWHLLNHTLSMITMFLIQRWRPSLEFSFSSLKEMVPFGSRILLSNLLVSFFLNVRSIFIGRLYTASDLAYFNRGKQFPQSFMESIFGTVQSVSLSYFSKNNSDLIQLKNAVRKVAINSYLIIFPLLTGLCVAGANLIELLLTAKWMPSAKFLQIFCIAYIVQPPQLISSEALKALGLSKITLRLEIVRKTIEIASLVIVLKKGPIAIALSAAISGIVILAVSLIPNSKYLDYSFWEQVSDIFKPLSVSMLMAILVWFAGKLLVFLNIPLLFMLIVQFLIGVSSYWILCHIFRLKEIKSILTFIRRTKNEEHP
jgi:O-antigen/teichoic acid export membrane protein